MPPVITLDRLERGIPAVVDALHTQGAMRRRLMDIGLTPGTEVRALYRSCSGDPTAYGFRGAVIALRREDAETVTVKIKFIKPGGTPAWDLQTAAPAPR